MKSRRTGEQDREEGVVLLLIVCAAVGAHGLLLLTDYKIWDGWWLTQELIYGRRFDLLLSYAREFGRPTDYLYWRFLGLFGRPEVAIKFLALAAWIAAGIFMFKAMKTTAGLGVWVAGGIAVIFVVCPAYKMMGESILFMNTMSVAVFWAAWWMHGRSIVAPALWRRGIAVVLFVLSFNLNSLLVFYYAVGAAFLALKAESWAPGDLFALAKKRVFQFPELVALPVIYWVFKSFAAPASGHHADYNKPSFDPSLLAQGYWHMWEYLLLDGAKALLGSPLLVLGAGIASVIAAMFVAKHSSRVQIVEETECFGKIAVCGVGLLLAAALPYIAVGQNLASESWLSRNSILVGMPLGMMAVGVLGWLAQRFAPARPAFAAVPLLFVCLLCIVATNRNTLELEAFAAKQESVRVKLRAAIAQTGSCVVQLRDYYLIPGTVPYYPPIIWTYLAAYGDDRPRTFVIDITAMAPPQEQVNPDGSRQLAFPALPITSPVLLQLMDQTTMPWLLDEVPREGPQTMFIVQQGKLGSDGAAIGFGYLWRKWFDPESLLDFVDELTTTAVLNLPPVGPS